MSLPGGRRVKGFATDRTRRARRTAGRVREAVGRPGGAAGRRPQGAWPARPDGRLPRAAPAAPGA